MIIRLLLVKGLILAQFLVYKGLAPILLSGDQFWRSILFVGTTLFCADASFIYD